VRDPLTTGDSSLSACIQSILALEIGYIDAGREYFRRAALMDLADIGGNVADGCHIASMGGTWMAIVYGFAGMRDYGGRLSFAPRLPDGVEMLRFPLFVRGQTLEVAIDPEGATYSLREGTGLSLRHWDEEIALGPGESARRTVRG
jgi:alpha,alpha-trehalose phosphorylase